MCRSSQWSCVQQLIVEVRYFLKTDLGSLGWSSLKWVARHVLRSTDLQMITKSLIHCLFVYKYMELALYIQCASGNGNVSFNYTVISSHFLSDISICFVFFISDKENPSLAFVLKSLDLSFCVCSKCSVLTPIQQYGWHKSSNIVLSSCFSTSKPVLTWQWGHL